jgi:RNA-directed DNA polymerase
MAYGDFGSHLGVSFVGWGVEFSPEKTKITTMTDGFEFLGFHVTMQWDQRFGYYPRVEIPKAQVVDLRYRIKQLTGRNSTLVSLGQKLQELNPILRGWANYYRYCTGAGRVFTSLDWYVNDRLWRWMRKKHPKATAGAIARLRKPSLRQPSRRLWRDHQREQYILGWTPVCRYRLGWMRQPDFAVPSGEPDAQRKTHVRFGERRGETDRREAGTALVAYSPPAV